MKTQKITFNVGDLISVNDVQYTVKGKIVYEDQSDTNYSWDEYFISDSHNINLWLSIDCDDIILWNISHETDTQNALLLEKGNEVVHSAYGNVDVESGDAAFYEEYEDASTKNCYCIEHWDDETEYSVGERIPLNNIKLLVQTTEVVPPRKKSNSSTTWIVLGAVFLFFISIVRSVCSSSSYNSPTVYEVLNGEGSLFSYKTSITGQHNMFADIYSTSLNTDSATINIIDKIEGNVDIIQENPHDSEMVVFLTPNEICLIYHSVEDSSTLIHLASREWTIMNFDQPLYQADSITENFYRSFYDFNGFSEDSAEYSDDELNIHYQSSGYRSYYGLYYGAYTSHYMSYASTVRQSAIQRRGSSGGGSGGGGK